MVMLFSTKGAALGALFVGAVLASPAFSADTNHGKEIFLACAACHTEKADALGPSLKNVVGRKAGSLEDFRYSPAMKRAGFNWTEGNLRDYLTNPQGKVKGNRMPFSGLPNATDVNDVIAYLVTLK
jgi:cytochrome c